MCLLPSQCVGEDTQSSEDFEATVIPESLSEAVEFDHNDLPHSVMWGKWSTQKVNRCVEELW